MMILLFLQISVIHFAYTLNTVRVLFVNEEENEVAHKTVDVVIDYINRNPQLGVELEIKNVVAFKNESVNFLSSLCSSYEDILSSGRPPHLIFDTTRIGYASETVKYFTASLGLPTISSSFGEPGDLRQWRMLADQEQLYLLQIRPPSDMMADIMRPMVIHQKIPNAAIFHDDTFVLQHKYKSLLLNFATRHTISVVDPPNIRRQLMNARELDVANFFILGNLSTVRIVLEGACAAKLLMRRCAWHVITTTRADITFLCPTARVLLARPALDTHNEHRMEVLRQEYQLTVRPEIMAAFYFDLFIHSVVAVKNMLLMNGVWPTNMSYITCEEYTGSNTPHRHGLNLKKFIDNDIPSPPIYGTFVLNNNGQSAMQFSIEILGIQIADGAMNSTEELATWETGQESNFTVANVSLLKSYINDKFFRVVTVEQKPFIFVNKTGPRGFSGFCIDLMDEIARMCNFNYDIRLSTDGTWGSMDTSGKWSGVIRDLVDRKAELGLGAMAVMAEREAVVDFSIPFYEMVGIGILMKQSGGSQSLFKFLTVLETEVWLCVLIAYFFTSLLMWIFDVLSPFSYQNSHTCHPVTCETRIFSFRECLWFSMTSLTPQGGGEAPRNTSGRLVAATWWMFGFILIASYTANLAAFLTVSRLDSSIESLEDLAKQYKYTYAPINGSQTMMYFKRMAAIEEKFYEIWKDMSLNDSLGIARSRLSVWEYPLSDKYSKLWAAMQQTGLPETEEAAVQRVRASKPEAGEGFAYLGDATDLKYLMLTNCDLRMIGEEFSKKAYAIAIQRGHPLKEQVDNAILTMVNRRYLTHLKDKWWPNNPEAASCEPEEITGISIQNIAGVFIVVLIGTSLAILSLTCDKCWTKFIQKYRKVKKVAHFHK